MVRRPRAGGRLILVNPKDSGGSVNYTLDANPYTMTQVRSKT